jgi:hypothetical protein
MWRNRLPDRLRKVLTVMDDTDVDKLTRVADKAEEAYVRNSRANKTTAVTQLPAQSLNTIDSLAMALNALSKKVDALAIDKHRRSRSSSRRWTR